MTQRTGTDLRCPRCPGDAGCGCRGGVQLALDPESTLAVGRLDGVWELRPLTRTVVPSMPRKAATVVWSLLGGPCAGEYMAHSSWPPPEIIRAVHGGKTPAVLDLPEDVVELGETVALYRLQSHGFMCGRGSKRTPLHAGYIPAEYTDEDEHAALTALLEEVLR